MSFDTACVDVGLLEQECCGSMREIRKDTEETVFRISFRNAPPIDKPFMHEIQ